MDTGLPVEWQRARTDEFRKLPSSPPSRQVHLKEAILRVQESGGARDVFARAPADRWNAERVSRDRHRTVKAGQRHAAIEDGQARVDLSTKPPRARAERSGSDQEEDHDRPRGAPTHNVHLSDADENAVRRQSLVLQLSRLATA